MIHTGDCVDVMRTMPDASVDAVVTDPPYGLEFMGKEWDRFRVDDPGTQRHRGEHAGKHGEAGGGDGSNPARSANVAVAYGGGKRPSTNRCVGCGKRDQFRNPHSCPEGTEWRSELIDPHAAPPTMLAFQEWCREWALECKRVLKPGGYLLAFGGTRTVHRLASAIEDAGFEIRDELVWIYASGFPKSLDVGKAMDKRGGSDISWFGPWLRQERIRRSITQKELAIHFPSKTNNLTGCVANWELGLNLPTVEQFNKLCEVLDLPFDKLEEAQREVTGQRQTGAALSGNRDEGWGSGRNTIPVTAPATDLAKQWDGWGTALKPAHEPIVMARKPLVGTVAGNVAKYGTGALNIDGTRIPNAAGDDFEKAWDKPVNVSAHGPVGHLAGPERKTVDLSASKPVGGRWPSNILLSDPELFDEPNPYVVGSGATAIGAVSNGRRAGNGAMFDPGEAEQLPGYGDSGGYSRFFIVPKADRADREPVLRGQVEERIVNEATPPGSKGANSPRAGAGRHGPRENAHPTVKPTDLMRHLVRLVTPPGGTVLDPFLGSGSTAIACELEGFPWIGIEKEPEYVAIAEARLNGTQRGLGLDTPLVGEPRKSVDGVAVNRNRPEEPTLTGEATSWDVPKGRRDDVTYRKPKPAAPVEPPPVGFFDE